MRGRDSPCWSKGAWPLGQLANRFSSVPFHLTVSHTLLSKWVFVQVLLSYRSVCEDVYAGAVYANCLKHFGTGPACSKFSKATFIHRITSLFYLTNCTINFLFSFKLFNVIIHTATDHNEKKLPSYRTSPSRLAMDMNCTSLFLLSRTLYRHWCIRLRLFCYLFCPFLSVYILPLQHGTDSGTRCERHTIACKRP